MDVRRPLGRFRLLDKVSDTCSVGWRGRQRAVRGSDFGAFDDAISRFDHARFVAVLWGAHKRLCRLQKWQVDVFGIVTENY